MGKPEVRTVVTTKTKVVYPIRIVSLRKGHATLETPTRTLTVYEGDVLNIELEV